MTTSSTGRSPLPVRTRCICVEHVEALDDLAEQAVLRRQTDAVGAGDEEELAAVGVRAGVGHGDRADLVLAALGQLVLEAVAGAAAPGAGGVAALAHEAVDDAMEDDAVVVVVQGEVDEVVDRLRCLQRVEGDDDLAERGVERRRVPLVGVDPHLRRPLELLPRRRRPVERRELISHRPGTLPSPPNLGANRLWARIRLGFRDDRAPRRWGAHRRITRRIAIGLGGGLARDLAIREPRRDVAHGGQLTVAHPIALEAHLVASMGVPPVALEHDRAVDHPEVHLVPVDDSMELDGRQLGTRRRAPPSPVRARCRQACRRSPTRRARLGTPARRDDRAGRGRRPPSATRPATPSRSSRHGRRLPAPIEGRRHRGRRAAGGRSRF